MVIANRINFICTLWGGEGKRRRYGLEGDIEKRHEEEGGSGSKLLFSQDRRTSTYERVEVMLSCVVWCVSRWTLECLCLTSAKRKVGKEEANQENRSEVSSRY